MWSEYDYVGSSIDRVQGSKVDYKDFLAEFEAKKEDKWLSLNSFESGRMDVWSWLKNWTETVKFFVIISS